MKLSFDRNHQIFNCFRNSFRNVLLCCCRSAEKVRCCKAFQGFCDRCARKFSRPPRYDRFDIPPCLFFSSVVSKPRLTLVYYHKKSRLSSGRGRSRRFFSIFCFPPGFPLYLSLRQPGSATIAVGLPDACICAVCPAEMRFRLYHDRFLHRFCVFCRKFFNNAQNSAIRLKTPL